MNVYLYDKTFDGLLTAVFDAYFRKTFPDALLSEGDTLPLFCDDLHTVVTDEARNRNDLLFRLDVPVLFPEMG